jgi:hypothetical protein
MKADNNYKIERESFGVKLSKTYRKVHSILPAPFGYFTLLASARVGEDVLVQVDAEGLIVFEHKFKHRVDSLAMVNRVEAMVLETKDNQITVFNLTTKDSYGVPFNFMREESDQS